MPFCPNISCPIWPLGLRMNEMHHVTYMYRPCLNQNGVEMWKRSEWLYSSTFSGAVTWFITAVKVQNSSVPFFLQRVILPQRTMLHFTLGITFQYHAPCQLHYRLLLDQKGAKICKRGKWFYITALRGSVTYFVKAVDPRTWANLYIKMIENGEIAFLYGI